MRYRARKRSQKKYKRRLEDQFGKQYSMILEDVEIEGEVNAPDNLLMSGNLKGEIKCDAVIWISENGSIDGNIDAGGLIV